VFLHWNGRAWRPGQIRANTRVGIIWDVVTVSGRLAWAVGTPDVLLRWNGSSWAKVRHPATSDLYGIGSRARSAVTVGDAGLAGNALILSWNGTTWSAQHVPAYPGGVILYGAAVSGTKAWAVGVYGPNSNLPVILARSGTTWAKMPVKANGVLYRVAADSARDAWAVGASSLVDPSIPVAVHWNGSSWKATPVHL
jgi:hypothetical protein